METPFRRQLPGQRLTGVVYKVAHDRDLTRILDRRVGSDPEDVDPGKLDDTGGARHEYCP